DHLCGDHNKHCNEGAENAVQRGCLGGSAAKHGMWAGNSSQYGPVFALAASEQRRADSQACIKKGRFEPRYRF
ncbi:hypothetical protein SB759_38385, partial [Pseudomonas sp. SIMBA_059]